MTLIRDINNILEYGRKTTSYKFATLLALFDYITGHASEVAINNLHFIPIVYLSRQFISYYYPFSFYNYYQGSLAVDKNLKVLNYIDDFKSLISNEGALNEEIRKNIQLLKEGGIFWINRLYDLPEDLPEILIKLLWKVRKRILMQPLHYLHNVNGEIIRFFGIMNNEIDFKASYDEHREKAMTQKRSSLLLQWTELLNYDSTSLVIDDLTYQELARYRFWARDVILKAWFNYCLEGESKKSNSPNIEIMLYKLLGYVYTSDLARDPSLISHYRDFYAKLGDLKCIYSGKVLDSSSQYHIDHFLPWSFYPINRFWNLYPSEPSINIKKSNNIPEWNSVVEENIRSHISLCLKHKNDPLIQSDLLYYYQNLQKNTDLNINSRENELIEEELVNFLKLERKRLLEIIPGSIFTISSDEDNEN